ncbi:Uncharacterised protein [Streptococcus pneumoniae]|nr:Uncharacterised protein [Streptococcus pneumoniae]
MELHDVITKIPAKSVGIFPFVYNSPVKKPAKAPDNIPSKVDRNGFHPKLIAVTATAPPKGKEPSVVMSGKFKILKVR